MDGITILPSGVSGGGGGDKTWVHTQANASSTWNINHNLGKHPAIRCTDLTGNRDYIGQRYDPDLMNTVITYNVALSGRAECN